jgi:hypothetical protein
VRGTCQLTGGVENRCSGFQHADRSAYVDRRRRVVITETRRADAAIEHTYEVALALAHMCVQYYVRSPSSRPPAGRPHPRAGGTHAATTGAHVCTACTPWRRRRRRQSAVDRQVAGCARAGSCEPGTQGE